MNIELELTLKLIQTQLDYLSTIGLKFVGSPYSIVLKDAIVTGTEYTIVSQFIESGDMYEMLIIFFEELNMIMNTQLGFD